MANEFKIRKGLIVEGASGGTVVDVQGSQGQLFSVTDDLSGSIFAVSDISGVPILDVNSSGLSTFSGNVTIGSLDGGGTGVGEGLNIGNASPTIQLFDTTNNAKLLLYTQDSNSVIGTYSNHSLNLFTNSTLALTLDTSQNATFAGDAIFENNIEVNGEIVQTSTGGENQFASALNMGSNEISDLADPTAPQEAATKAYVDAHGGGLGPFLPLSAGASYPLTGDLYIEGADKALRINNGTQPVVYLGDGGANTDGQLILYSSTGGVNIVFNGDDQNHYITNGNVGIGKTNPSYKLDVSGDIRSTGATRINTNALIGGYIDVTGIINHRSNLKVLNKAATSWITWVTRDTSGSESVINLSNIKDITALGNVGIGTTSPTAPLHIEGGTNNEVLKIEADVSPFVRWVKSGSDVGFLQFTSTSAYLSNMSNGSFFFRTNNTDKMVITSVGNVGIGTTTFPTTGIGERELLVQGAIVSKPPGADDYYSYLKSNWANDGAFELGIQGADTNHKLITTSNYYFGTQLNFHTSDQKRMVIDTNGNVGIGTTSPGYLLDLSKTAVSVDTYSGINLQASNYGYTIEGGLTQNIGGELIFSSNNAGTRNPRVKFAANGNVGIGTSTPNAKLDIQGTQGQLFSVTDDLSGDIFSVADISGVPIMTVNSSGDSYFDGNVGIGTTSTTVKLDVNGSARFNTSTGADPVYITRSGSNDQALKIYVDDSAAIFESIQDESADNYGAFQFVMDAGVTEPYFDVRKGPALANTLFRVDGNGNVGIGTTSPGARLDVVGTGNAIQIRRSNGYASIKAHSDNGGNLVLDSLSTAGAVFLNHYVNRPVYIASGGGNVGIGTTTPGSKLDVDGKGSFGDATTYALKLKSSSGARGINILSNDGTSRGGIDWSSADFIIRNASDDHLFRVNYSSKNATLVGNVTATNFILSSDKRLKENIEKVCDNRVKVDWKTFELKTEKGQKRYGVIAQELEENHPEFVKTDDEGFKSVKYIDLLIAKIAELEARLEKAGI